MLICFSKNSILNFKTELNAAFTASTRISDGSVSGNVEASKCFLVLYH